MGDAAGIPTSKAGSVTHFEGEILVENIQRFLAGEALDATFDGHANCFIETGFGKALMIDFNYDTEPLPGHFRTLWVSRCYVVSAESPGQANVPTPLLAQPASGPRYTGHRLGHARARQAPRTTCAQ